MGFVRWLLWLFGNDGDDATSPVSSEEERWLEERWVWLESTFGTGVAREAPVVLPSPRYFPDRFDGSDGAKMQLLARVCEFMRVDPKTITVAFYSEDDWMEGQRGLGPRSASGTAGLYRNLGDSGHEIGLEAKQLADPEQMVATMAHELAHVHLIGGGRISPDDPDHEPLTDLLTVYLGLGVFTANAVVTQSTWEDGKSQGWSVGRTGYLSMPAFGYALALLARTRQESRPDWSRGLRLDVRSAFDRASRYLRKRERSQGD